MEAIQKPGLGIVGATLAGGLKKKINITIRQVENGFVIYFDSNGYASGEKTHIAKNAAEIIDIVEDLLK